MRTSLFLVFLVSACAVESSPVVSARDAVPDGSVSGGAAGMSGIVGLFQDAQGAPDADADDGSTDAAQSLPDGAVMQLKDAGGHDAASDSAAGPDDAQIDAATDAEPDDAAQDAAADAAPDADADAKPALDDEGTCDLCNVDADCPATHSCASDGLAGGVSRACLPKSNYCASGSTPPFVGGEYLTHLAATWNACWPEQNSALIGCAAWRQLVGIPE